MTVDWVTSPVASRLEEKKLRDATRCKCLFSPPGKGNGGRGHRAGVQRPLRAAPAPPPSRAPHAPRPAAGPGAPGVHRFPLRCEHSALIGKTPNKHLKKQTIPKQNMEDAASPLSSGNPSEMALSCARGSLRRILP